ncbi:hypothetical protein [Sulfitobacter delicatus]|uniref:Uncharacterized protein n=1 Tax=Sulfitobacter delicatus TaxID=218672 RepID=A0A1G7TTR2_9RHOB|nr:hypothetical protein [Sulfitobacter delicatus]SDG38635.1 hypothetical protein SAMN04489759_10755 [Sulfitobacter delicatus]
MKGLTLGIAKPVLLWALHFATMYALISAACAPRALLSPEHLVLTAVAITVVFVVLQIIWMWSAHSKGRRPGLTPDAFALARAAWWSGLISLIATIANLTPVLILPGCHG